MTGSRAELIGIGTELLGPFHTDTNGAWLSRRLGERGVDVRFRTLVGDDPADLRAVFTIALTRSDLIVATGGLGPTVDDLTREAVSEVLGIPLEVDAAILRRLEERFSRHNLEMPPQNRRQAQVPRGAEVLPNRVGTAPGLWIAAARAVIVLVPGVPSEMQRMVEESVLPRLGAAGERYAYRIFKIAGLMESEVDRRLETVARSAGDVVWTILAAPGQVEIHLRERVRGDEKAAGIDRLDRSIAAELGPHLVGRDQETLEDVVGRLLVERGETVAVAESLTGGGLGERITSVPGASRYFRGGIIAYTDEAKAALLGVPSEVLRTEGAVSAPVAAAMAAGARRSLSSTWGVAATGYAGPAAVGVVETPGSAPGTVFVGLAGPDTALTREIRLPGTRDAVRTRAARTGLDLLRRALLGTGV